MFLHLVSLFWRAAHENVKLDEIMNAIQSSGVSAALKTWWGLSTHIIQFRSHELLCPHHVIFSREGPKTWRGHFPMSSYVWAPLILISKSQGDLVGYHMIILKPRFWGILRRIEFIFKRHLQFFQGIIVRYPNPTKFLVSHFMKSCCEWNTL